MGKKKIITKVETEVTGAAPAVAVGKRGAKRQVLKGVASISSSYNNTIISISDQTGNVLASSSAGGIGFKGARKSTPYAATLVAKDVIEKVKRFGLLDLNIAVRGIGPGREAAVRALISSGLNVLAIVDNTPIAHNGVRPPKPRRV